MTAATQPNLLTGKRTRKVTTSTTDFQVREGTVVLHLTSVPNFTSVLSSCGKIPHAPGGKRRFGEHRLAVAVSHTHSPSGATAHSCKALGPGRAARWRRRPRHRRSFRHAPANTTRSSERTTRKSLTHLILPHRWTFCLDGFDGRGAVRAALGWTRQSPA